MTTTQAYKKQCKVINCHESLCYFTKTWRTIVHCLLMSMDIQNTGRWWKISNKRINIYYLYYYIYKYLSSRRHNPISCSSLKRSSLQPVITLKILPLKPVHIELGILLAMLWHFLRFMFKKLRLSSRKDKPYCAQLSWKLPAHCSRGGFQVLG